ncbi:MAG: HK97 gp10 family phage protein [Candidatus Sphingomonas colombiensis]|nr:HK97 gp10 family phage protein [Sphingomonas sp.]WEK42980.1 MAG: HK97 gp10 family phage protein [Sphingomonas sp.]
MIKIEDSHAPTLARIHPDLLILALGSALEDGAKAIAEDAAFSIRDGAISGAGHVPSAPGQPPNADTHDLDQSIHVGDLIEMPDRIQTAVIADSDHALYMELGTSTIAERPFMRPAVERNRRSVIERVASTFGKLLR